MRGTKSVESVEEQERVLPRVSIKSWISDLGPQLSDLIRPMIDEASINEVVYTHLMSPSTLSATFSPVKHSMLHFSPLPVSAQRASASFDSHDLRQPQDYDFGPFIY